MATTPRAPRFQPGMSQAELQAGFKKVGDRTRVKKTDIQKAYQPYGLKLDPRRARSTDTMLYRQASLSVVKKLKRDKAKPKPKAASATGTARATGSTAAARTSAAPAPVARQAASFDDAYVARAMRNQGLFGVDPALAPAKVRSSPVLLTQWIQAQKAAKIQKIAAASGVRAPGSARTGGGGYAI